MMMQPCIPSSEQGSHLACQGSKKKLPYQLLTTACSLGREEWARPHWANVPLSRRSANPETLPREKITIRFVFFIVAKAAAREACDRPQLPQKSLMQIRRHRAAVLEVAGQPVPHVLLFYKSESWKTLMSIYSIFGSAADRGVISSSPKRLLSAASDKAPIAASASVRQTRSFHEGTADS